MSASSPDASIHKYERKRPREDTDSDIQADHSPKRRTTDPKRNLVISQCSAASKSGLSYDDFKPIRNQSNGKSEKQKSKTPRVEPSSKTIESKDRTSLQNSPQNKHVPHFDERKRLEKVSESQVHEPKSNQDPLPPLPPIDAKYISQTFTHSSAMDKKYGNASLQTYERLEFLGDAYIELISTRLLYERFPNKVAGKLAQMRETLVRNSTLAKFSKAYGFDERVEVTDEDQRSHEKTLADVFEAYVASVVESSKEDGFGTAQQWLTALWDPLLRGEDSEVVAKNYKAKLQNKIVGYQIKIEYKEDRESKFSKESGLRQCFQSVYLTGWGFTDKLLGSGQGNGKVEAGMMAAKDALENNHELLEEISRRRQKHLDERKAEKEARA